MKFRYFDFNENYEPRYRENKNQPELGEDWIVNPVTLVFNDGYYYLAAYFDDGKLKHYRLDCMQNVEVLAQKQKINEHELEYYKLIKMQKPAIFSMWLSEKIEMVKLKVHKDFIRDIYNRFGKVKLTKDMADENYFITDYIRICVSDPFVWWVAGFGKNLQIVSPDSAKEKLRGMLKEAVEIYGEQ